MRLRLLAELINLVDSFERVAKLELFERLGAFFGADNKQLVRHPLDLLFRGHDGAEQNSTRGALRAYQNDAVAFGLWGDLWKFFQRAPILANFLEVVSRSLSVVFYAEQSPLAHTVMVIGVAKVAQLSPKLAEL